MNVIRILVASFANTAQVNKEQKTSSPLTAKVVTILEDMRAGARSLNTSFTAKISPPPHTEKLLCKEHIEALRILTKIQQKDVGISDQEKMLVRDFLSECMGNKKLNKTFQVLKHAKLPEGIDAEILKNLRSFSYKSIGFEQLPALTIKIQVILESLEKGQSLPDRDKLTLTEWGRLEHFESAIACLIPFDKGVFSEMDDSSTLGKFIQEVKALSFERKKIETLFQSQVKESNHYQNGDILTYIGSKWAQFKGRGQDKEEWLTSHLISKYGHAGKLHRTETGVDASEIFSQYQNVTFDVHEAAFSHVWRLDILKLIKKDSRAYWAYSDLLIRGGSDPDEVIVNLYHDIERELHEKGEEKFAEIYNVKQRRWDAGWADVGLKGGHRRKKERTDRFEKVHQKMLKRSPGESADMICSEFATKATIAALIELDRRLTERLEGTLKGMHMTLEIFGDQVQGEPRKKAEMAGRILNLLEKNKKEKRLNFISLPIDNKERLKRIHPGRMVNLLKRKHCIVRIEPPPVVKAIFKKSVFA